MLGQHHPAQFILRTGRSTEERWQAWINKIYRNTGKRKKPLKFTPPKRCIEEQRLTPEELVELREDFTVWQGEKKIGAVNDWAH